MEKAWCNCTAWCLSQAAAASHKTSPTLFHNSLGAGSLIWFKRELKDHRLRRVRSARYNYNKLAASVDRKYFSLDIYLRIRLIITVDITPCTEVGAECMKGFPLFCPGPPTAACACLCPDFFCQLFDGLYKILAKLPDEPTKVLTRGRIFSADLSAGGGGDGTQWQYLAVMMTQ